MGRSPAFLFFPKDWLHDPDLRRCSPQARAMWIDMICLLHNVEEYGVFASAGKPWPHEDVAAAVGGDKDAALACLSELLAKGVAHLDNRGAIFCRRMVEDEAERSADRERKRTERSVRSVSTVCPAVVRSLSPPSSSSSSSAVKTPTDNADAREVRPDQIEHDAVWNALNVWATSDSSRSGRSIDSSIRDTLPVDMAMASWAQEPHYPGSVSWSEAVIRCCKVAKSSGGKFGDNAKYAIAVINGKLATWRKGTPPEPPESSLAGRAQTGDDGAMERGIALSLSKQKAKL